jgi:hypothetical protein
MLNKCAVPPIQDQFSAKLGLALVAVKLYKVHGLLTSLEKLLQRQKERESSNMQQ